jgi:hypothetical protein
MSAFLTLYITISSLLLILLIIGYFLPNKIVIQEEIDVKTSAEEAFKNFADLKLFSKWHPWFRKVAAVNIQFEGEALTVSNKIYFKSKTYSIQKKIEISHLEANRKVFMEFDFGYNLKGNIEIDLISNDIAKTHIYFNFYLPLGSNPLIRWYGFITKTSYHVSIRSGLKTLKVKLETT